MVGMIFCIDPPSIGMILILIDGETHMGVQRAPGTRPIFAGPDWKSDADIENDRLRDENERLRSENEALKIESNQVRAVLKNASIEGPTRRRRES